jgi:hypothetical protein
MSDVTEPWYAKHLRTHFMCVFAIETKLAEHEREVAAYKAHGEHFGRLTFAEAKADGLREALAILRR